MSLFDIENKPLEVFAFWVIDVYRVVCGLSELMQNSHFSACLCCGRENGKSELLFVYCL